MYKKRFSSVIILIDGYNLLKKIYGIHVSESNIHAFVNVLGSYIKKRNHKIIVMLDGGLTSFIDKEKQKGIDLWYSGHKRSADEIIIEYVIKNAQKDILVVTEDREILQKIQMYKKNTIDPLAFYARVQEVCYATEKSSASDVSIKKTADEENPDLDEVMLQAAHMKASCKEEHDSKEAQIKQNKLSKKEKLRKKSLDKL